MTEIYIPILLAVAFFIGLGTGWYLRKDRKGKYQHLKFLEDGKFEDGEYIIVKKR